MSLLCDICGDIALDTLRKPYRPNKPDVEHLCSHCCNAIHDFEMKIINMNRDIARTKGLGVMIPKYDLVKAKVVCMKYGLTLNINKPRNSIVNKFLNRYFTVLIALTTLLIITQGLSS